MASYQKPAWHVDYISPAARVMRNARIIRVFVILWYIGAILGAIGIATIGRTTQDCSSSFDFTNGTPSTSCEPVTDHPYIALGVSAGITWIFLGLLLSFFTDYVRMRTAIILDEVEAG